MRPGPRDRLDRPPGRGERRARAGGAGPLQGDARILGVKNMRAIATAACRDAVDGPDFIARGEKALGAKIQVLSGQQEAELAAKGIMMGFRSPDGLAGDLGGGSLEIIDVGGKALRQSVTLPLGGLRLIDASGGRIDKALDIVDEQIGSVAWLEQRAQTGLLRGRRHLARHRQAAHGADRYPLHVMHGYSMPTKEAIDFCEDIRKAKKLSSMPGIEEIARPRREVLPLWRPGARAAVEAARVRDGALLRVRHPRGPGLQPAVGDASGARTRCSRSAPTMRACGRGRPSTQSSFATGRTPCSSRRAQRRRKRSGACGMRPACSPTSAGGRIRTIAASRA